MKPGDDNHGFYVQINAWKEGGGKVLSSLNGVGITSDAIKYCPKSVEVSIGPEWSNEGWKEEEEKRVEILWKGIGETATKRYYSIFIYL